MSTKQVGVSPCPNGRPRAPAPWRVLSWVLPEGRAARRARSLVAQVLKQAEAAVEAIADAEMIAAELAANAETHACRPYEMRVLLVGQLPIWCEVFDAGSDLKDVAERLRNADLPRDEVHGRGLPIVRMLSGGQCAAYPSTALTTGVEGKAVAFSLIGLGRPSP